MSSTANNPYFQLWASRPQTKPPTSSSSKGGKAGSSSTAGSQRYRVDLDAPGGVTYAPSDETGVHGMKRRLFLPRRGARDDEYDYGWEIAQRAKKEEAALAKRRGEAARQTTSSGDAPFAIGDDDDDTKEAADSLSALQTSAVEAERSDAQRYKDTIDMTPRLPQEGDSATSADPSYSSSSTHPSEAAPSILSPSHAASTRSTRTTATTLALQRGELPKHPRIDGSINVASFRPPPSITGDTYRSVDPWNAPSYSGRTEFDRMTEQERDKGITKAEEFAGEGMVPTRGEVEENAAREGSDGATIKTTKTRGTTAPTTTSAGPLLIRDIFIPDPRPYRPLRLVRRSDPRQALVVCSGLTMSSRQAATYQAAVRAAKEARGEYIDLYQAERAKKYLDSFGGDESGEVRGGLGVYFCPPDPMMKPAHGHAPLEDEGEGDKAGSRAEGNFSPVIAALEYVPWHEEGFDKIVVAIPCAHEWLVRGIANDLHEWRRNAWRLTRAMRMSPSPSSGERDGGLFGQVGETVPDRDLWECLDAVVTKWEEVDVSVRFWCLAPQEEEQGDGFVGRAHELAKEGAAKDNQQPQMVRWVKKKGQQNK
ncbi:hypothetical protein BDZ90DRAFT_136700 [Jaminaea rosea]|uniref:Uncharacterized protein n=1 Tax=Jaminaea rosea TaxID=1569628 RepID=A0A316UUL4_9BASI|nr:hypothetical protein BDZ90DRAFT_136700 [Jaminaea rosea]PWN29000.1 hypothetical protein BDZ90DRAFT_136700 [Jaminaea rosea]